MQTPSAATQSPALKANLHAYLDIPAASRAKSVGVMRIPAPCRQRALHIDRRLSSHLQHARSPHVKPSLTSALHRSACTQSSLLQMLATES